MKHRVYACVDLSHRADNFIVGLTNVSPVVSTPTLWNYTVCGQYPGTVPAGKTVSLYCQDNLPPFRFVIVQLPLDDNHWIACEIEVLVTGMKTTFILTFLTGYLYQIDELVLGRRSLRNENYY